MRLLGLAALVLTGCAAPLPVSAPPLADFERPVALLEEPDDEAQRLALDPGSFSGLEVTDARDSLAALVGEPEGLQVARVVENSPAAFAGLSAGDLLLEARVDGEWRALGYPSDWRRIELEQPPGSELRLLYDRAGSEFEATLVLEPRLEPAGRLESERFSEDERAGFVVRTASEVEARAAGLGPGAGVVLVGLAGSSPWRGVDLRFGDLLVAVDGRAIAGPEVLLDAVRQAELGSSLAIERVRGGERAVVDAPVSRREVDVREIHVPLLYRYDRDPDRRVHSALLGLVHLERTRAAWRLRLLWLLRFGRGDTDELEEVSS